MMERELKYKIPDENAFCAIGEHLPELKRISRQTNHYFVGEDSCFGTGDMVIRIREKNGTYKLTFKHKLNDSAGYFVSEEIEEKISHEVFMLFCKGDERMWSLNLKPLEAAGRFISRPYLKFVGCAITDRYDYELPNNVSACLDRTTFPDRSVDFEIEVETEDPESARNYLRNVFEKTGLSLEVQNKTKYKRFLDVVKKTLSVLTDENA